MYPQDSDLRLKNFIVIFLGCIVCISALGCLFISIYRILLSQVDVPSPSFTSSKKWNIQGFPGNGVRRHGRPYRADHREPESRVVYRNAFWKPEIGLWLSQCGATPTTSISERFPNNACHNDCSGHGVCNHDLGECRCFHGYGGKGCEREVDFPCTSDEPWWYLGWRSSWCGAKCDKRKAFCHCGEGTIYPHRPVVERCGFVHMSDGTTDYDTPDPLLFANNSTGEGFGWCNLDPNLINVYHDRKMIFPWNEKCYCMYDGYGGPFCDQPVESVCINQCSGNGHCRGGSCACAEGWYGIDCSVPSKLQSLSLDKWPSWLSSSTINIPLKVSSDSRERNVNTLQTLAVEKRRPLIYIYDMPAELTSHLREGRQNRYLCSTRSYDEQNNTIWIDDLYGAEVAVLESLLASPHRTNNPEEADYFYVPSFEACAREIVDAAPHTDMQEKYLGLRGYYASAEFHKKAYDYIKENYPYWDRSGGKDHIWLLSWDEGACHAPKEIWSSIMLVHWGNTMSKYNYSTTEYPPDSWADIPIELRGTHPCYDPAKDIVIPAWKTPQPDIIKWKLWARPREERITLFYFNGNLGDMYEGGRVRSIVYSMGLRQKLAAEFGSRPNRYDELGRQWAPDVTVVHERSWDYGLELSRSRFCGVFPGDGWSGRLEDSILHGCIPVIVQDGIHLPFEDVLDYDAFTVRIAEKDLPDMVKILRGINETRIDSMLAAVRNMWQRFTYHNNVKLEAQRQKFTKKEDGAWAREYNKLNGDDAFSTLIQALHFKLGDRPWETISKLVTRRSSRHSRDHCGDRPN
ncbi:unnamed protein product [Calypogeia fissa]